MDGQGDSMIIDGIAASEAIDSSGEILDVKGCDISDFNNGTAVLNWEHSSTREGDQNPLQIIGKIVYGKKIFKESDCEDDRQLDYWNKIKLPFIYIKARLYDGSGHPGAMAAAAMIRDHIKNNEKILLRYSIEGSTLDRKDNHLLRSVARRVAATIKPCNRSCDSGVLYDPQGTEGAIKGTEALAERLLGVKKEKEESAKKFEHPGFMKLGSSPELEIEAGYLTKTLTAGGYNAAPSALVGGSALQRAPKGMRVEHSKEMSPEETKVLVKKMIKAKMLKSLLSKAEGDEGEDDEEDAPISDDERSRIANAKVRLIWHDANGNRLSKPMIVDEDSYRRFMPHSRSYSPKARGKEAPGFAPQAGVEFDADRGVLHTQKGSFPLYIPNDSHYMSILNDPRIVKAHGEAMKNWGRLHDLLKQGKVAPEVAMYAALFSGMSPNNPVPMQEIAFSHLVDMINEGKINPAMLKDKIDWSLPKKESEEAIRASPEFQEFVSRVGGYSSKRPMPEDGGALPQHARAYWSGPAGSPTRFVEDVDRKKKIFQSGVYQKGLFGPLGKFKSVAGYGLYKDILEQLIQKHGSDGRAIARALHAIKSADDSKSKRNKLQQILELSGIKGELTDPLKVSVVGLAPKTIRYALGMMGFGDMPVPDTHWTRHAFDLDRDRVVKGMINSGLEKLANDASAPSKDRDAAQKYLALMGTTGKGADKAKAKAEGMFDMFLPHSYIREVMWNPENHDEMVKLDDYYEKNHPAIATTAERLFGDKKNTKNAVFPGFWLHWLTINPHESIRKGTKQKVYNEGTHHVPYFMVTDRINKQFGLEPLTSEYDQPFSSESYKRQMESEHAEKLGSTSPIILPPSDLKPKSLKTAKPKKLGKAEGDIEPNKIDELRKLVAAHLSVEKQLGTEYGQFYFYHQILPRLLRMGGMLSVSDLDKLASIPRISELGSMFKDEESSAETNRSAESAEETEGSWSGSKDKDKSMPKVSDKFIDTFEEVADNIDKIKIPKMTKTELWMHELFLMSKLKKEEVPADPDILQDHHIHHTTHPEMKDMIKGMRLEEAQHFIRGINASVGAMGHVSFWTTHNEKPFYVKGQSDVHFPHSANEAASVNMAHHLGLSEYFPHVAMVEHGKYPQAVIQGIVDMKRPPRTTALNKEQVRKQDENDIQKLALFDHIIMNTDRHSMNYGYRPDGKIVMFDHGFALEPSAYKQTSKAPNMILMPHYANVIKGDTIRPDVAKWVGSMDSNKMADLLKDHGLFESPDQRQDFVNHIESLKQRVQNPKMRVGDLFMEDPARS